MPRNLYKKVGFAIMTLCKQQVVVETWQTELLAAYRYRSIHINCKIDISVRDVMTCIWTVCLFVCVVIMTHKLYMF